METIKHIARLVVRETDQTQTVTIDTLPFTIGRQADLYLTNSQVSREHAIIHEDAEGFFHSGPRQPPRNLLTALDYAHSRGVIHREPTSAPDIVNRASGAARASPKSSTFTCPPGVTMMFEGLMHLLVRGRCCERYFHCFHTV